MWRLRKLEFFCRVKEDGTEVPVVIWSSTKDYKYHSRGKFGRIFKLKSRKNAKLGRF